MATLADIERARTEAYVTLCGAAWAALETAQRHGHGSPEHVAARVRTDEARAAFGIADDAQTAARLAAGEEA